LDCGTDRDLNVLIQICGKSPAPLVDSQLARMDQAFSPSVLSIVEWVRPFRALRIALLLTYDSFPLLVLLAAMVPTLQGRYRYSYRLLWEVTMAGVVTAAMFALWPAVGPWVVYGFKPTPDQAAAQNFLLALKSHHPMAVSNDVAAIVSFPSFHVVLALFSAPPLWQYRLFRPVVAFLTLGICVSTVTTGWHYVVDVLGGLAVTAAIYPLANRFLDFVLTPRSASSSLGEVGSKPAGDEVTSL
jgi:membrane-associated phospholipid phosphatase